MILPDVNVLLYAFRTDSTDHRRYHTWLSDVINGPSAYGVSPQVMCSVVRIATHPHIYHHPSRLEEVLSFCRVVLEQPNATLVVPGEQHWTVFDGLCRHAGATGNLIADAWLAALAIESGCQWITTDRDFSRFPGLTWRTPW